MDRWTRLSFAALCWRKAVVGRERLAFKIVLAGATMCIGGVPAFAHGGSVGHSSSSVVSWHVRSIGPTFTRMSPSARSIGGLAPPARMLVTTAPNALARLTNSPASKTADPPTPSAATLSTSSLTNSPSTTSNSPSTTSGGTSGPQNLSQFNTGAQDLATPAVSPPTTTDITSVTLSGSQLLGANSPESAVPAVSAPTTTEGATTTTIGTSVLTAGSMILPNAATSGAVPQAPVSAALLPPSAAVVGTEGEVIATSGGSSGVDIGATGRDMPECMAAWDKGTHMTKTKWLQVCARTLKEAP